MRALCREKRNTVTSVGLFDDLHPPVSPVTEPNDVGSSSLYYNILIASLSMITAGVLEAEMARDTAQLRDDFDVWRAVHDKKTKLDAKQRTKPYDQFRATVALVNKQNTSKTPPNR